MPYRPGHSPYTREGVLSAELDSVPSDSTEGDPPGCLFFVVLVFLAWALIIFFAISVSKGARNETPPPIHLAPSTSAPTLDHSASTDPAVVRTAPTAEVHSELSRASRSSAVPRSTTTTARSTGVGYGGVVTPTDAELDALARCEVGGRDPRPLIKLNTGNGFLGPFQFMLKTWRSVTKRNDSPLNHTYEEQRDGARRLIGPTGAGWGQFPDCSRKLGKR